MNFGIRLCVVSVLLSLVACSVPPNGRMVSFSDYKLHVKDNGIGDPTVIVEAGLGCGTDLYDTLHALVSEFTRIITYDHAGIDFSTRSPDKRTLPNYVNELQSLLDKEKIAPPYILVGHSLGGFIIRYYANLYPDKVAGLVFIDQPSEEWFDYIRSTHSAEDMIKFNKFFDPGQTPYKGVYKEERELYELNCTMIKGIGIPQHIPVRMITSVNYGEFEQRVGYHPEDMKVWAEKQATLLRGVEDAQQIITETGGHLLQMTEPELVVNSVKELVDKYRNAKSPVLK